jgi:hypothetical protein
MGEGSLRCDPEVLHAEQHALLAKQRAASAIAGSGLRKGFANYGKNDLPRQFKRLAWWVLQVRTELGLFSSHLPGAKP